MNIITDPINNIAALSTLTNIKKNRVCHLPQVTSQPISTYEVGDNTYKEILKKFIQTKRLNRLIKNNIQIITH